MDVRSTLDGAYTQKATEIAPGMDCCEPKLRYPALVPLKTTSPKPGCGPAVSNTALLAVPFQSPTLSMTVLPS